MQSNVIEIFSDGLLAMDGSSRTLRVYDSGGLQLSHSESLNLPPEQPDRSVAACAAGTSVVILSSEPESQCSLVLGRRAAPEWNWNEVEWPFKDRHARSIARHGSEFVMVTVRSNRTHGFAPLSIAVLDPRTGQIRDEFVAEVTRLRAMSLPPVMPSLIGVGHDVLMCDALCRGVSSLAEGFSQVYRSEFGDAVAYGPTSFGALCVVRHAYDGLHLGLIDGKGRLMHQEVLDYRGDGVRGVAVVDRLGVVVMDRSYKVVACETLFGKRQPNRA